MAIKLAPDQIPYYLLPLKATIIGESFMILRQEPRP